ncbi:MAG: Adenylate kinase [candidate division TM6 bacterium GW2011_GWF2_32_72]|nr:MAG: Adenylate kinase [candidate division TM6 bacterium GW2011_GWF2_32_72]
MSKFLFLGVIVKGFVKLPLVLLLSCSLIKSIETEKVLNVSNEILNVPNYEPKEIKVNEDSKTYLIFVGAPCCGKGTMSKLFVEKFNFVQLSTGNLFRDHISRGSDIGKEIESIIKSGGLVSDEIVSKMVNEWLISICLEDKSVILDGYPRTAIQAQSLYEYMKKSGNLNKTKVIHFEASEECLVNRACGRLVCKNGKCQQVYSVCGSQAPKVEMICDNCSGPLIKRVDDSVETVKKRLAEYSAQEEALLKSFCELGLNVIHLEASREAADVFEELNALVKPKVGSDKK